MIYLNVLQYSIAKCTTIYYSTFYTQYPNFVIYVYILYDILIKYTLYHMVLQWTFLSIFLLPLAILKFCFCPYIELFSYICNISYQKFKPLLALTFSSCGKLGGSLGPARPTGGLLPLLGSKFIKVDYMFRLFGLFFKLF